MNARAFWLSFCDTARPTGQRFLGACVVEVVAVEADEAASEVSLRFPFAQPDAEWVAAALKKAHRLGCNPGGEVSFHEIPADHSILAHYPVGVLMDRATLERIDKQIEAEVLTDA